MSTDTGHRNGCSFGRTARCNCTYLAQWDRTPEYTAPTFRIMSAEEFLSRTSPHGSLCYGHDRGYHYIAGSTCEEFEQALKGRP